MLYFSEITGKTYKTEEEATAAENEYVQAQEAAAEEDRKKKEEKKLRKAEVDQCYKEVEDISRELLGAFDHREKVRKAYVKDYGNYTYTSTKKNYTIDGEGKAVKTVKDNFTAKEILDSLFNFYDKFWEL